MSRWIDADALIEAMGEEPYVWTDSAEEIAERNQWLTDMGVIESAPSIDIVKCGDCKYWKSDGVFTLNALGEEEQLCKWWSKFGTIRTAETAFCSYGERSE